MPPRRSGTTIHLDQVDDLADPLQIGDGRLRQLFVVERRDASPQPQNSVIEIALDSPDGAVKAVLQPHTRHFLDIRRTFNIPMPFDNHGHPRLLSLARDPFLANDLTVSRMITVLRVVIPSRFSIPSRVSAFRQVPFATRVRNCSSVSCRSSHTQNPAQIRFAASQIVARIPDALVRGRSRILTDAQRPRHPKRTACRTRTCRNTVCKSIARQRHWLQNTLLARGIVGGTQKLQNASGPAKLSG